MQLHVEESRCYCLCKLTLSNVATHNWFHARTTQRKLAFWLMLKRKCNVARVVIADLPMQVSSGTSVSAELKETR
jgi:hypothetical protein